MLQRIGKKKRVMFLDSGPPGAGRQKGGLYDDIKRIKKPGENLQILKRECLVRYRWKQSGARIVVREAVGLGADITVYAKWICTLSGGGGRRLFFPLHACSAYGYESVTGQAEDISV